MVKKTDLYCFSNDIAEIKQLAEKVELYLYHQMPKFQEMYINMSLLSDKLIKLKAEIPDTLFKQSKEEKHADGPKTVKSPPYKQP